jgi:signal peptidase II
MPAAGGYAGFLHGQVVDMFYFPIYQGRFPSWVPIWGGEPFEFFNAIFNVADMAISFGVGIILVFQKWFFKPAHPIAPIAIENSDKEETSSNDLSI